MSDLLPASMQCVVSIVYSLLSSNVLNARASGDKLVSVDVILLDGHMAL